MPRSRIPTSISFDGPATYRINVIGRVDGFWADRLAGMRISSRSHGDGPVVTSLIGPIKDQAELLGVLNSIYDMHIPILSVETLGTIEDDRKGLPAQGKSTP